MNIKSDKWFRLYNRIIMAFAALLVIVYLVIRFVPALKNDQTNTGLSLLPVTVSLCVIIYSLFLYPIVVRKMNYWMATLGTVMLYLLSLMNLIIFSTAESTAIYILVWLFLAAFAGLFGLAIVVCFNFLTLVYIFLVTNFQLGHLSDRHVALLFGSLVTSVTAYFLFWRSESISTTDKEVKQDLASITGIQDVERQSETIVQSIGDGVVVLNKDRKISLINATASKITGWPIDEAVGIDADLVFKLFKENGKDTPLDQDPFTVALKSEKQIRESAVLQSRQNTRIVVSYVISPIILQGQSSGVVGVFSDISTQRAAEKQKEDFISTASHEMRTPVAAIEGYLSLAMNEKVSSVDDRAKNYLEKAHTSTQQLGKLFQDLLTSSKAEDGRLVNHPEVVEMSSFISKLSEAFSLAAEKKHLIVEFSIADNNQQTLTGKVIKPLYYVHVDPERIREVITNIFDNAVKYTPSGKITIGLNGDQQKIHIFIKDTGSGIPASDIPHLFQKFYRVDNSAVRTIGGTGLGLYICKKIVELYNGTISVESTVDQGSTFNIDLPRITDQQASNLMASDDAQNAIAMPQSNLSL